MRRLDPRLSIITKTIENLIPGATPAFLNVKVTETFPNAATSSEHTWTGDPAAVAERIFTALYGRPVAAGPSPLAQSDRAKAHGDIGAMVEALTHADHQLTHAPWYPARPGDLVHIHYEATEHLQAFGETYVVSAADHGLMDLRLLAHTCPDQDATAFEGMVGTFAVEASDDPLYTPWFEAGPACIAVIRDGQVVHGAPARRESEAAAAGTKLAAMTMAAAIREAEQYLERGEPELALARLRSDVSLAPCGAPGPMADMAGCARPSGHRPPCSPDADYTTPPHECPALPEQLHAVVTIGAKVEDVHIAGLYEDRQAAVDHCTGFATFREDLIDRHVRPAPGLPDETVLTLPAENQYAAIGVQLAVTMPVRVMPDPFAEDAWAEEGKATCLGPEDYADNYDHEDA